MNSAALLRTNLYNGGAWCSRSHNNLYNGNPKAKLDQINATSQTPCAQACLPLHWSCNAIGTTMAPPELWRTVVWFMLVRIILWITPVNHKENSTSAVCSCPGERSASYVFVVSSLLVPGCAVCDSDIPGTQLAGSRFSLFCCWSCGCSLSSCRRVLVWPEPAIVLAGKGKTDDSYISIQLKM